MLKDFLMVLCGVIFTLGALFFYKKCSSENSKPPQTNEDALGEVEFKDKGLDQEVVIEDRTEESGEDPVIKCPPPKTQVIYKDKIKEVPKVVYQEKIVEVPKIVYVERPVKANQATDVYCDVDFENETIQAGATRESGLSVYCGADYRKKKRIFRTFKADSSLRRH